MTFTLRHHPYSRVVGTHSSECWDTLSLSLCACPELHELPISSAAPPPLAPHATSYVHYRTHSRIISVTQSTDRGSYRLTFPGAAAIVSGGKSKIKWDACRRGGHTATNNQCAPSCLALPAPLSFARALIIHAFHDTWPPM